jgi:hypothetical protein
LVFCAAVALFENRLAVAVFAALDISRGLRSKLRWRNHEWRHTVAILWEVLLLLLLLLTVSILTMSKVTVAFDSWGFYFFVGCFHCYGIRGIRSFPTMTS